MTGGPTVAPRGGHTAPPVRHRRGPALPRTLQERERERGPRRRNPSGSSANSTKAVEGSGTAVRAAAAFAVSAAGGMVAP